MDDQVVFGALERLTFTPPPLRSFDGTPGADYPIRLLEAYLHNARVQLGLVGEIDDATRGLLDGFVAAQRCREAVLGEAVEVLVAHRWRLERVAVAPPPCPFPADGARHALWLRWLSDEPLASAAWVPSDWSEYPLELLHAQRRRQEPHRWQLDGTGSPADRRRLEVWVAAVCGARRRVLSVAISMLKRYTPEFARAARMAGAAKTAT